MKLNELLSLFELDRLPETFEDVATNSAAAAAGAGGAGGPASGGSEGERSGGIKRRREVEQDGLLTDGDFSRAPPTNDIYRSRQQKKVHVA